MSGAVLEWCVDGDVCGLRVWDADGLAGMGCWMALAVWDGGLPSTSL